MARGKSSGATANGKAAASKAGPKPPPLLDRQQLDAMRAAILGTKRDNEALSRAQDLAYDAWEAKAARTRRNLAQKALAISPLCADAYVLLAEQAAPGSEERLELYQLGMQAGERALGNARFKADVGHFWLVLETRPYMRARFALAQSLWMRGDRDEAIAHYQDLLRFNPNDNQGVRYVLAARYLDLDRDDDLAALLDDCDDEASTIWEYTRALASFRRDGDTNSARRQLRQALDSNAHVPDYVLGKRRLPKALPAYLTMGGEDEAIYYAFNYAAGWARTPGALDWLCRQHQETPAAET